MELHEIEELVKAVNHNAIKALLRAASIMKDPNVSSEMRAQAEANFHAISQNKPLPSEKKPRAAKKQVAAPPASPEGVPFHQEFARVHGVDPVKFKAAYEAMNPEQQALTHAHHAEHMKSLKPAGPAVAPSASPPVAPAPAAPTTPVIKSVDALHNLFTELKARL